VQVRASVVVTGSGWDDLAEEVSSPASVRQSEPYKTVRKTYKTVKETYKTVRAKF